MILEMFIFSIIENVSLIMLKSNCNGSDKPKLSPYANHHNESIFAANCPISPPITRPDSKNTNNIHIFFSLVAICAPPYFSFVKY